VEITDPTTHDNGFFDVQGGAIRIRYEISTDDGPDDKLRIEVRDDNDDLVRPVIDVDGDTNGPKTVKESVDPGDDFTFEVDAGRDIEYFVIIEDCRGNDSNNNNNNGGRNNGDRNNNGGNNTIDVTQTPTDTTTQDTNTASPAAETTTAARAANADFANRPDSGSFRCDLFLRTVRDENGALRAQYRDGNGNDELIVQRFEQCLSEDVLADTIPNRNLPFTGGPLLPSGGGLLLLVAAAILARRIIRR